MKKTQPKRSRFYAFALNEFNYKRISFTRHGNQLDAEKAAYKHSGQAARGRRRLANGCESATDDLDPMWIAGLEGLEEFAKENRYRIDWENLEMIHEESK